METDLHLCFVFLTVPPPTTTVDGNSICAIYINTNHCIYLSFYLLTVARSQLRLIRPHQNTNFFVRINRSDELRVPFNIGSQWSVSREIIRLKRNNELSAVICIYFGIAQQTYTKLDAIEFLSCVTEYVQKKMWPFLTNLIQS